MPDHPRTRRVKRSAKRRKPSAKGKGPPAKSGEFFYLDEHGNRQDASLHEQILEGGDHRAATAIGKQAAREIGLSEEDIARMYPDD